MGKNKNVRKLRIARDLAVIMMAYDALDQVIKKVTNWEEMRLEDRMMIDFYKKMDRIIRLYRGSSLMRDAAKIAVNAYDKVGHAKPNATSFAVSLYSLAYEKSGMKVFSPINVKELCDLADAIVETLGGTRELVEATDYAEKMVKKVYASNPQFIDEKVLRRPE